MEKAVCVLLLVVLCGCNQMSEAEQLSTNKPIRVAESDSVVLWKIKDSTPGGKQWVYYTTPNGHVAGQ